MRLLTMKSFVLLMMVFSLWLHSTMAKDQQVCKKDAGHCVAKNDANKNCVRLSYKCIMGKVCCQRKQSRMINSQKKISQIKKSPREKYQRKNSEQKDKPWRKQKPRQNVIKKKGNSMDTRRRNIKCGIPSKICHSKGGICIDESSGTKCQGRINRNLCKGLRCSCCLPDKLKSQKNTRRLCRKTTKTCSKEGGTCISSESHKCKTTIVNKLCKGASCSCCLGDSKTCAKSPGCRFHGGICVNKMKLKFYCTDGTINESQCSQEKCSCCLFKRNCQCGRINVANRIIGGVEVSLQNKYPWHVGLKIAPYDLYACGATIINDRYVITAGHCLYDPLTNDIFDVEYIKVGLADHAQFSTEDDVAGVTKLVDVEKLILHRNYDITAYENDIALIKLKDPMDLSTNDALKPVCLPTDTQKTYRGKEGTIIGWGYLDYDLPVPSEILMEVNVPILSQRCPGNLPDYIKITSNMICAGTVEGGKDSCSGDSGGSLVVKDAGRYTLVGITSFGYGCGEPDIPGIYTRVTKYLDWIMRNTRDANYCS